MLCVLPTTAMLEIRRLELPVLDSRYACAGETDSFASETKVVDGPVMVAVGSVPVPEPESVMEVSRAEENAVPANGPASVCG